SRVGPLRCSDHRVAQGTNAQHATAAGDDVAVVYVGTRVKDVHVVINRLRQAADDAAFCITAGVAVGSHDHTERGLWFPACLDLVEATSQGRVHQFHQVAVQSHHDGLGFRVAKTDVEFQHLWCAVCIDHQARV